MKTTRLVDMWYFFITLALVFKLVSGCQFYPYGDYLRFVRVSENTPIFTTILRVEVHPRHNLSIQAVDRLDDASYFGLREVNNTMVSVVLLRSLDDLVDNENPRNVLKFRMVCDFNSGVDTVSSYMSVTVYVEDVNDHAPIFVNVPYHVTVDELTPVGLTLFRGIQAIDRDKPNTPNSDVHYAIVSGNEEGKFALESSHKAVLVLRKPLDYDSGDKEYKLRIIASDRGVPPRNSTVFLHVKILDNDDLNPRFTRDVYKTQIPEFYPITGRKIHKELRFKPAILAYDADLEINSGVRYDITAGNERGFFYINPTNGSLFLEKEVDLEQERSLIGNTFSLQIQASQVDNPLKTGYSRVEVKVLDINDNLPEFEVDLYNISIVENLPNGFSVLQVIATDRDQGENAEFTYQLEDSSKAFNIEPKTGWLTVRNQSVLDREKQPSLTMRIYAREKNPNIITEFNKKAKMSFVTVEVTLIDANDNNPTFVPSNLYEFHVSGDARVGHIVGHVKATDPDSGKNGRVMYNFQLPNVSNLNGKLNSFAVDPNTGIITVNEYPLEQGKYAHFVEASDQPENPSERRFSLAVVTIEVLKVGENELIPDFIGAPYEFWVGGDVAVGTSVGQIRVTEAVVKSSAIYDLLHSYQEGVPFAVEETSGVITVVSELSKFERQIYDFEALVTNEKDMTLVTNLTIHVVDPEEYKQPIIRENNGPIELRVRENMPGALVGQIGRPYESPYTNKTAWWKSLRFVIANQPEVSDKFAVSSDGTIYTQKGLDREEREVYHLTVVAENIRGNKRRAKVYQVTVLVEDENDNPPVFEYPEYEGHILENSPGGSEVTLNHLIVARDADTKFNAQFKFTLYGEGSDIFVIDQASGRIFLRKNLAYELDREEKGSYQLRIVAKDKGNLYSEVKLVIYISDMNDNPPKFMQMVVMHDNDIEIRESNEKFRHHYLPSDSYFSGSQQDSELSGSGLATAFQLPPMIFLPENISIGTSIIRLMADDKDSNSSITYKIIQEVFVPPDSPLEVYETSQRHFVVHSTTGEVVIAAKLSPETEYNLIVSAIDNDGFSDNVTLRIYVKDVNDHAPTFTKSSYSFDLLEGVYSDYYLGKVESIDADYKDNANVTYFISKNLDDNSTLPFRISPSRGEIFAFGNIDRERKSSYTFEVTATDNARGEERLSSTVVVDVHISDVNDNSPQFYYFDHMLEISRNELEDVDDDNSDLKVEATQMVPVYYASVPENIGLGIPLIKVSANDTDFSGNGNGLCLFDIIRRKNQPAYFEIDSKEGVVTVTNQLSYDHTPLHNITIVASDLGKPSLSSTALLMINVVDVPDDYEEILTPIFDHRYYEVEVEENSDVPLELLTLNVSDRFRGQSFLYSVVPGEDSDHFGIEALNGVLSLLVKPDRETKENYEIKVRADRVKKGRGMATLIYPPPPEKFADLGPTEVRVVVKVKDLNDNAPVFEHLNRPIIAVIPKTAGYGHEILRLQATDPDDGLNGDIRYYIIGRGDGSQKFKIDPKTGQIRSIVSFVKDAGKVFGFDVKAVDRRGADSGRSSIANVFVYVLDSEKQVVMTARSKAVLIERNIDLITSTISNITGLEVGARRIEPHTKNNQGDAKATDVYLYAINPSKNALVSMDTFHKILEEKGEEIRKSLDSFRILDFDCVDEPLPTKPPAQKNVLSIIEVAVVVLGCIVFVGAMASAICVGCMEREKKRKRRKTYPAPEVGFTLAKAVVKPSHMFPASAFHEGLCHGDTTDTYVDLHSTRSSIRTSKRRFRDSTCYQNHRHNMERGQAQIKPKLTRSQSHFGRLESSMISFHSGRKDSTLSVDRGYTCSCEHLSDHSSEDSSNGSYEDSLKSFRCRGDKKPQHILLPKRESFCEKPLRRNLSESMKSIFTPPPPPPPPPPQSAPSRALLNSLLNKI